MEGLLIHSVVRVLAGRLPLRSLGWAFPDEGTAALLLEEVGHLVLRYRPPNAQHQRRRAADRPLQPVVRRQGVRTAYDDFWKWPSRYFEK